MIRTSAPSATRLVSNSSTSASIRIRFRSAIVMIFAATSTVSPGWTCRVVTTLLIGAMIRVL
ncbi:MAG: hypothetical protein WB773_09485, partial [Isosphaeraceae bacterium]